MKNALWLLVAVALLPLAGCAQRSDAAQPGVTTSTEATTRLYVRSLPAGAEVRIDGQTRGTAPQLIDVPAGATSMTVEVALPGGGSQRRVVEIAAGRITRVEFEFGEKATGVSSTAGRTGSTTTRGTTGSTTTGGTSRTVVGTMATTATDQDPVTQAKAAAARAKIAMIEDGLNIYKMETGRLPTAAEGLKILWEPPAGAEDAGDWIGPILSNKGPTQLDLDPWGNPIEYRQPGRHNPDSFDVFSRGPDGKADTADDIDYWQSVPSVVGTTTTGVRTGGGRRAGTTTDGTTRAADETAVREAITRFVQAAVVDDRSAMDALLDPEYQKTTDHGKEMREVMQTGMMPADLQQVIVRGDRALAASRLMRPSGQLTRSLLCVLYTLVKQDEGWVIRDIDMEDAESLAEEIRRFEGDETAPISTWSEPVEGVQCRLRTEMPTWPQGTVPKLLVDLQSEGARGLQIALEGKSWEIEIDGAWQQTATDSSEDRQHVLLEPGAVASLSAQGNLDESLRAMVPGKHTLRVARRFHLARRLGDPAFRLVSNPIEIEILSRTPSTTGAVGETATPPVEARTGGGRGATTGTRTATRSPSEMGTTTAEVPDRPRINQARAQIAMVLNALDLYKLDMGRYPAGPATGLTALWQPPADAGAAADWNGPYLQPSGFALPDPWGNAVEYRQPGRHNPDSFDVFSRGPDGQADTADDIGNWRPAPDVTEVDKIIRAYTEAVWAKAPAELEGHDEEDLGPLMHQVAAAAYAQYIVPNLDTLVTHFLERLPEAPAIERSEWTVRTIKPSLETSSTKALARFVLWQPVSASAAFIQDALVKELGVEVYGKRMILRSMAPTSMALVEGGLDRPVILMAMGDELLLAHLQRSTSGIYECNQIEWLRDRRMPATKAAVVYTGLLPADATPATRLLNSTSMTVWGRLAPRLDTMEMSQIAKEASALTAELLRPKRDLLAEEAARRLARLPKAEPIDRTQWQPAYEQPDGEPSLEAFLAEASKEPDVFAWAWDPMMMASQMRTVATSRAKGPEAMGIQNLIATVAMGYANATLAADPAHPVIATHMGNEMTIVGLRRTPDGAYVADKFEWLARKE